MYQCKHFRLEELVPPTIFRDYGIRAWQFLDEGALKMLDKLRDKFGKITVNDWKWNGTNKYRGFRPHYCTIGANQSQHRFGRAFDCIFADTTAEEVRKYILEHPKEFRLINSMEEDVSWLHFDTRNCERILTYKP